MFNWFRSEGEKKLSWFRFIARKSTRKFSEKPSKNLIKVKEFQPEAVILWIIIPTKFMEFKQKMKPFIHTYSYCKWRIQSYHCAMCDVDCTILIEYLCEGDQSSSWSRFLWRLILKVFIRKKPYLCGICRKTFENIKLSSNDFNDNGGPKKKR